jgi:hypothetical protein
MPLLVVAMEIVESAQRIEASRERLLKILRQQNAISAPWLKLATANAGELQAALGPSDAHRAAIFGSSKRDGGRAASVNGR